ncbi:MAG: hypothetical protein WBF31_01160, partial [Anaerolineae bacterium]
IYVEGGRFVVESEAGSGGVSSSSKCSLVFYHRDHKERREVADSRLICRFFVFSVFFAVECVLHLELLGREAGSGGVRGEGIHSVLRIRNGV